SIAVALSPAGLSRCPTCRPQDCLQPSRPAKRLSTGREALSSTAASISGDAPRRLLWGFSADGWISGCRPVGRILHSGTVYGLRISRFLVNAPDKFRYLTRITASL